MALTLALDNVHFSTKQYGYFSYFFIITFAVGTHLDTYECVEVSLAIQANGVMSSTISLTNLTFTIQALLEKQKCLPSILSVNKTYSVM